MTSLKIIVLLIPLLIIVALATLSFTTRHNPFKVEPKSTLEDCPDKDNCVFSQATRDRHKVDSLEITSDDPQRNWDKLINIIQQSDGDIIFNDGQYCHAVFTSTFFRFKDDLELLREGSQIHIRSASRAGRSDLGVNRKRVEAIRTLYNQT
jgi:uncharacterized protein (DUF1499 family)